MFQRCCELWRGEPGPESQKHGWLTVSDRECPCKIVPNAALLHDLIDASSGSYRGSVYAISSGIE
jgi:hypothetical protein